MFTNYSYERCASPRSTSSITTRRCCARNPFLRDSLLIGQGGERIISKVAPSLVYNTVDQPIFPTTGKRFTAVDRPRRPRRQHQLLQADGRGRLVPAAEQPACRSASARQVEYIHTFSGSQELPIFEKLFLGGEYSIRGFDIRTIGPQDPLTGLVLGGNKSLLFNIEEQITIAGPVRLIAVLRRRARCSPGRRCMGPPAVRARPADRFDTQASCPAASFNLQRLQDVDRAEVRFFMPVLNVPFRLIFAYNPQRDGVLDNNFQPQKAFQFRFAVGSTF